MARSLEMESIKARNVGKYGDYSLWPAIDYKLKNVGDEVAIVTSVFLEILESRPDLTPKLYFQILPSENGSLILRIVNLGWGDALEVEFSFWGGNVRSLLSGSEEEFVWKGVVQDHVEIKVSKPKVISKKEVVLDADELEGHIKYKDSFGKAYEEPIKYDSIPRYPTSGWKLIVSSKGFNIQQTPPSALFSMMYPSAIYDTLLEPLDKPYKLEVKVSQAIGPNEADRFQIVVASTCAADYVIKSYVEIDGVIAQETEPLNVSIRFLRYLPNLFYREGLPFNLDEADQLKISSKGNGKRQRYRF